MQPMELLTKKKEIDDKINWQQVFFLQEKRKKEQCISKGVEWLFDDFSMTSQ